MSASDDIALLVVLHLRNARQGPGGETETRLAIQLAGREARSGLSIADIGCGAGASSMVLASHSDAAIHALDIFPEFLEVVQERAEDAGCVGANFHACRRDCFAAP